MPSKLAFNPSISFRKDFISKSTALISSRSFGAVRPSETVLLLQSPSASFAKPNRGTFTASPLSNNILPLAEGAEFGVLGFDRNLKDGSNPDICESGIFGLGVTTDTLQIVVLFFSSIGPDAQGGGCGSFFKPFSSFSSTLKSIFSGSSTCGACGFRPSTLSGLDRSPTFLFRSPSTSRLFNRPVLTSPIFWVTLSLESFSTRTPSRSFPPPAASLF